jgi:fructose-1,6-bisphosphatase/inositol monophosphatase family enzyme
MGDDALLAVLRAATAAVRDELAGLEDWGLAGTRPGQYRSDLVADRTGLEVLEPAGLGVLSEESGLHHPERDLMVAFDPVDGSTNASRQLPWWATSVCAVDAEGPRVAVVVNQVTGTRFEAVRGEGACRDDEPIRPSATTRLADAIVGVSGLPSRHLGWKQFRALGAAALDLCAVAAGSLDAFVDCSLDAHAPWDYLGALLICREAGAIIFDAQGRNLVTMGYGDRRSPVAASTPELHAELVSAGYGRREGSNR